MKSNIRKQVKRMRTGWSKITRAAWDGLLRIPSHAPLTLAYLLFGLSFMDLRHSAPGAFSLTVFTSLFPGTPTWVAPVAFTLCGFALALFRLEFRPGLYAILLIPLILYAVSVMVGVGQGTLRNTAINGAIVSIALMFDVLMHIRLRFAYDQLMKRAEMALSQATPDATPNPGA